MIEPTSDRFIFTDDEAADICIDTCNQLREMKRDGKNNNSMGPVLDGAVFTLISHNQSKKALALIHTARLIMYPWF